MNDNNGAGPPPVKILRPESTVTSEKFLRDKLISAASIFADLLRPTYGPKGLDKMLYKSNGESTITNDGAKIVSELMVKHPAAKSFVSLGESQESAAGDGVTGCILFAGALMHEAGLLINKGLHPLVIIDGFREACDIAVKKFDEVSSVYSDQELYNVAKTALTGKVTENVSDRIASLAIIALEQIQKTTICQSENFFMTKSSNNTPMSVELIRGYILEKKLHLDSTPKELTNCKVALINSELGFKDLVRDAEIEINSPEELSGFIYHEEQEVEAISKKLTNLDISAVFTTGDINKNILHDLLSKNIFVLGGLESIDLENIALATGATICPRVIDLSPDELGNIGTIQTTTVSKNGEFIQRIKIDDCDSTKLITFDIGGPDDLIVEETIRSIHDSIKSVCLAVNTKHVLRGGGNPHSLASIEVMRSADAKDGRERLGMEAFSRALETIPATLAANAGKSSLDTVIELRSRLKDDCVDLGVDKNGEISSITEAKEPTFSLKNSISSATETVIGLLRVDQLISSRGD